MTTGIDTPLTAQGMIDIDFSALSLAQLEAMETAAFDVLDSLGRLARAGTTITDEILKAQGPFLEWDHYPAGDVYDWNSHSQYYYHAHPAGNRPPRFPEGFWSAEHGHFHTFLRAQGMPEGAAPADVPGADDGTPREAALSHIIAISMGPDGMPFRLFTTNRWVTNEQWYDAETVIRLIDHFAMTCALPSRPVNTWITSMLRLFRPQIENLLRQRDAALAERMADNEGSEINAFDDRELEIASMTEISVDAHIERLAAELKQRRTAANS